MPTPKIDEYLFLNNTPFLQGLTYQRLPLNVLLSLVLAVAGTSALAQSASHCETPLDPRVKNSCVVSQGQLWRGARPSTQGAQALVERGVKTVVNLELTLDDRRQFQRAKPAPDKQHAIGYYKVRDWEPLALSRLTHRLLDNNVAQFIAITRTQPAPVYVHCRSGRNRTGVMVAAWKVFQGVPIETAIADMKGYKGEWFKADAAYLRRLTPQRIARIETRIAHYMAQQKAEAQILCSQQRCTINDDEQR